MSQTPPKLAIASLKLESGATTTTNALAWTWGKLGLKVLLRTASEKRAKELVEVWENVFLATGDEATDLAIGPQVILIDCPPLSRLASHRILLDADGMVLALPTTEHSQRSAKRCVSELTRMMKDDTPLLAGVLPICFKLADETHRTALATFHDKFDDTFISAPIPAVDELQDWDFEGGEDLPESCQSVFIQVASDLEGLPPFREEESKPRTHEEVFKVISLDEEDAEEGEVLQDSESLSLTPPDVQESEIEEVDVDQVPAAMPATIEVAQGSEASVQAVAEAEPVLAEASAASHVVSGAGAATSSGETVGHIEAAPIEAPSAAMESAIDGAFAFGDFEPEEPVKPASRGGDKSASAASGAGTSSSEPAFAVCVAGLPGTDCSQYATLALAQALGAEGQRVMVLNADQGSDLTRFAEDAEDGMFWGNIMVGSGRKGEARERGADCVVLHAPPLGTAGAAGLFAQADGVLLVVEEDGATLPALRHTLKQFSRTQASGTQMRLLGVSVVDGDEDSAVVTSARELLKDAVAVTPAIRDDVTTTWCKGGVGAPPEGSFVDSLEIMGASFGRTIAESIVQLDIASAPRERTEREPGTPYVLAMASHKGGTGRTTATLGLAWALGRLGRKCVLFDMNPTPTLHLLAGTQPGAEIWPNVRMGKGSVDVAELKGADFVIVDAPPILEDAGMDFVGQSHGVVLTTLPDPLAFRTIPGATAALEEAQTKNDDLDFLGLCVSVFDQSDPLQAEMIGDLRREVGDLCIEPPIPLQPELANWGLQPGTPLPGGPGRRAYFEFANFVEESAGLERTAPAQADLDEAPAPPPKRTRRPRRHAGASAAPASHGRRNTDAAAQGTPKLEAPQFRGVAKRLTVKAKGLGADEWSLFGSRGMTAFVQVTEEGQAVGLTPDQVLVDSSLTEKVAPGVMRSGMVLSTGKAGKPDAKRPGGVHPRGSLDPSFFKPDAEEFAAACKELAGRSAADALDECDDSPDGRFLAGILEMFGKSYDDSAEAFSEALENERKLGASVTRLGLQLVAGVQFGNGATVQFGPNVQGIKLCQVLVLALDGNIKGAAAAANELLEIEPEDLFAKLLRCELAMAEGTKKARLLVNKLTVDLDGESAIDRTLLLLKARALVALGLKEGAREALGMAAENGKGQDRALNAAILYESALASEAAGDDDAARRDFERLYSIDPSYADVAERLGL